jgi:hypothetical protein
MCVHAYAETPRIVTVQGMAFVPNSPLYNCTWADAASGLSFNFTALAVRIKEIECMTPQWRTVANNAVRFQVTYDGERATISSNATLASVHIMQARGQAHTAQ